VIPWAGDDPVFLVAHHLALAAECTVYANQAAAQGQLAEAERWLAQCTIHTNYADRYERQVPK
jgi:hypothetical protein